MDHTFGNQSLRKLIEAHFDLEDLRILCFDLGLDFDELRGDRKSAKIAAMINQMGKSGEMVDLLAALIGARPKVNWPKWEAVEESEAPLPNRSIFPVEAHNPFGCTGKIQEPANYYVRQPLTRAVIGELKKGVSLSIIGPSQTGKSSLLWHIKKEGPEQIGLPADDFIYLDMQLIDEEGDFFDYLCSELGVKTERGFRLARLLKGRKIILCLDEIEKMTWEGFSLNVRTELRGLADGAMAPFTLVIASRSPLSQLFPDSPVMTSPLAGLCMQINMPMFTLAETQALVKFYLRESEMALPVVEVKKAWEESEGHPRALQMALQQAFNEVLARGNIDDE